MLTVSGVLHAHASWPTGADGALVIDGTTFNLAAGSVKDYSSISIINGGVLNIQAGSTWTIIGCSGDCEIDATSSITGRNGEHHTSTASTTAPDTTSLSYTITQANGGGGGAGSDGISVFIIGGKQSTGSGGGGGGSGSTGFGASTTKAGNGGRDDSSVSVTGPNVYNGAGVNGNDDAGGAGGGSGASAASHGMRLYMKIAGEFILDGTIDFSGRGGQTGGAGGAAAGGFVDGGGGGGGAGGSGGRVWIKYKTGTPSSTDIDVTGGASGAGGAGGTSSGIAGLNGTAGNAGSKTLETY